MTKKIRALLPILALTLIPTILIWLPFFFRLKSFWGIPLPTDGMATIVANYDGPLFLVVAKTLYNPELIGNFSFTLPAEYYVAHFPLFPLLIKIVAPFIGFPYAMLFITCASSFLAIYFFKLFIKDYVNKKHVLWLTFIFAIFPARWLVVRSVGSPEPLFIATLIASVYYFKKKKYLSASVWGALAQLTKSPGILLFVAYFFALFIPEYKKLGKSDFSVWLKSLNLQKFASITLIPLSLLGLFIFFKIQLNDFFAYFHSGDNLHLFFPPFQIFNFSQPWVGTFWLEEVIFVYLFGILGLLRLIKQKQNVLTWFVGIFFISTLFVSHRDIIRYSLPMIPFLLAGFSKELVRRDFKIAIALIIIPIYLFSLAYISQNIMPVSDWAPLL
ncbi:hypothetical protein KKB40_05585 [Patescibacteria group bacterium]|nr:hypothetical protein [Patescibacteria group bacterium]